MDSLAQRLTEVRARIARAEQHYGRNPGSVRLLAVSKTRPSEDLLAALALGQTCFGESYVQEAVPKIQALGGRGIEWHFIGPLQANKTKAVAAYFDWVHSVDRWKIARRLAEQRPPECAPLNVCLQINVGDEATKAGVAPHEALALARQLAAEPRLRLRGLMTIPPHELDFERQRRAFRAVRELFEALKAQGLALDTLSMGMSDDLEAAIAEGATMVRIGTAVFGERPRPARA